MIDTGIECGVLNRSGAWFSYGETRLGQGKDAAKAYLNEHPAVLREVEDRIRQCFNLAGCETQATPPDDSNENVVLQDVQESSQPNMTEMSS